MMVKARVSIRHPRSSSEEPRSKLRGIFQGKSLINGGCHPRTPLAINPCSKLQVFSLLPINNRGARKFRV